MYFLYFFGNFTFLQHLKAFCNLCGVTYPKVSELYLLSRQLPASKLAETANIDNNSIILYTLFCNNENFQLRFHTQQPPLYRRNSLEMPFSQYKGVVIIIFQLIHIFRVLPQMIRQSVFVREHYLTIYKRLNILKHIVRHIIMSFIYPL